MQFLPLFALALALSYLGTWVVRLAAPRLGLLDHPRRDRWHRRPVPRLGGVAIYLAFTAPLLLFAERPLPAETVGLLAGGAAIFIVGLVDDLARLGNRPKLILLILCSVIPVLAGVRFELPPAVIGAPLAVVWILGATNAFNWLDNMDGVAAGVATIAALHLVALAWLLGGVETLGPAVILVGAGLGFLAHNFPPARVFMGDAGSGFLGFTIATVAAMGTYRDVSNVLFTVLGPGLIVAVPIFDTAMVTVHRVLNRRSVFQGGRDHPTHRLVAMGLPERKAVLLLYALSAVSGTAALTASSLGLYAGLSVSAVLLLGFLALGVAISHVRVYEGGLADGRAGGGSPLPNGLTPLPAPFANKRWIFLMLVDIILVTVAYIAAHLLRYEGHLPGRVAADVARTLPLILGAKMAGLYLAGIYRGVWRYAGMPDLIRMAAGATLGSGLAITGLFFWTRLDGFSRTALVLDWGLMLVLVAGSRFSLRLVREYLGTHAERGRRALIFGAGAGAVLLLQELRQNPALDYRPVGFVDDDTAKQGAIIQGLRVLGPRCDLAALIRRHRIEEVLLAAPSCPPDVVCEVARTCRAAGVEARRIRVTLERADDGTAALGSPGASAGTVRPQEVLRA
ncbi:MAG: hypothetical protein QME77_10390 [bacterium]|nr:hypothetical protein [bacterium]